MILGNYASIILHHRAHLVARFADQSVISSFCRASTLIAHIMAQATSSGAKKRATCKTNQLVMKISYTTSVYPNSICFSNGTKPVRDRGHWKAKAAKAVTWQSGPHSEWSVSTEDHLGAGKKTKIGPRVGASSFKACTASYINAINYRYRSTCCCCNKEKTPCRLAPRFFSRYVYERRIPQTRSRRIFRQVPFNDKND